MLQDFLAEDFKYPAVTEEVPKPVPKIIAGVGQEDTLRIANVKLTSELTETKEHLNDVRRRSESFRRERDSAKRKASRYDTLRKKHKAEHEKSKYWQKRAEQNQAEVTAAAKLKQVEREKAQLQEQLEFLEQQNVKLKQS